MILDIVRITHILYKCSVVVQYNSIASVTLETVLLYNNFIMHKVLATVWRVSNGSNRYNGLRHCSKFSII